MPYKQVSAHMDFWTAAVPLCPFIKAVKPESEASLSCPGWLTSRSRETLVAPHVSRKHTGKLFDSIVCSCVSPEHIEQVIPCQLEVGQQPWRKLPVQPSTESLHIEWLSSKCTLMSVHVQL